MARRGVPRRPRPLLAHLARRRRELRRDLEGGQGGPVPRVLGPAQLVRRRGGDQGHRRGAQARPQGLRAARAHPLPGRRARPVPPGVQRHAHGQGHRGQLDGARALRHRLRDQEVRRGRAGVLRPGPHGDGGPPRPAGVPARGTRALRAPGRARRLLPRRPRRGRPLRPGGERAKGPLAARRGGPRQPGAVRRPHRHRRAHGAGPLPQGVRVVPEGLLPLRARGHAAPARALHRRHPGAHG